MFACSCCHGALDANATESKLQLTIKITSTAGLLTTAKPTAWRRLLNSEYVLSTRPSGYVLSICTPEKSISRSFGTVFVKYPRRISQIRIGDFFS